MRPPRVWQCDGYTSSARVINCDCPSCRRTTDRSPSTHLHAEIDSEQATASADETQIDAEQATPGADDTDWGDASESDKEKERRSRLRAWAPERSESSRGSTTNDLEETTLGALEIQEEIVSSIESSDSGNEHMELDIQGGSTPKQTAEVSELEDHEE
ncbi:MAG: hypothetical protein Q9191_004051 [Dirinaria sp. TL-2023a]